MAFKHSRLERFSFAVFFFLKQSFKMGHRWRSSLSSSPPRGCGTWPLRGGRGGKKMNGRGGRGGDEGKEMGREGMKGQGWEGRREEG